jgi:hypothetical protein
MPKRDLTKRLVDTLTAADPIERLRVLLALQAAIPELRTDALQELYDAGWSGYAIAQELGISTQRLYQWRAR